MSRVPLEQAMEVAVGHHRAGRWGEAEGIYRQVLGVEPGRAEAMHLLGVLLGQTGRVGEGIGWIERAIARVPGEAQFHGNLGILLKKAGRLEEAVEAYRRAAGLKPDFAEAFNNLGNVLKDLGRGEEAVAACREAVRLRPGYAEAYNNLGNALQSVWRLDEAVEAYRAALALPAGAGLAEVHNNLGNALKSRGDVGGAVGAYREALRLRPSYAEAHSSLVYAMQYHPAFGAREQYEELKRWDGAHAAGLAGVAEGAGAFGNERSAGRRLKVGYVSPDFRGHPIGMLMVPVMEGHDRAAVEVYCYSDVLAADGVTERLRGRADVWRNIVGMSDEAVAGLIRQDGIDVLVDLTMHMARNRLRVFARRAAPVQVTWLAYPGTTGLTEMDYRLTDPWLDPPEAMAAGKGGERGVYAEETLWLPETYWCYDPLAREPAPGELPALAKGRVTFGCLNNFCKVNDAVLRLWGRVLGAVPGSRLLLLAGEGSHRERTREALAREGVSPERVEFTTYRPRAEYLKLYQEIDIGLDTVPYNGHTTSLDAFWMGVPVVTLVGETVVGRAGVGQLMNLGLPELIGRTAEEYVGIAAGLANDVGRLAVLRGELRGRIERSALMDRRRFAEHLEGAYREMWRRWCAGVASSGKSR
jgi:predicted O-linked N-acetylglucosamine transferase (SPINDLY family)